MAFCVLIADDEKMPRDILRQFLPWEELGVDRVLEAEDGKSALEQVRKYNPDIIISDIKMPRMNGMELAEAVRDLCPNCQFIFLSGYSDKEYLKGAIKLKAASYVEKPIDLEEIGGVLRDITAELRALRVPDPQRLFFRGRAEEGGPLNDRAYALEKNVLSDIGVHIKHRQRHETEKDLRQMYEDLRSCEGTDPEFVRHLYCQIVFLFLTAAESHNIAAVTAQSDYLLYTAVKLETLDQLWETLQQTTQSYFDEVKPPEDGDVVSRVNRYIEQHYTDCDLTVQSMARELGFANTYLCMAYKKSYGKTINQHLTERRMEQAKELLGHGDKKLYEVAHAVGYADGKYFSRLFTRETGLSPKQYRARHRHES